MSPQEIKYEFSRNCFYINRFTKKLFGLFSNASLGRRLPPKQIKVKDRIMWYGFKMQQFIGGRQNEKENKEKREKKTLHIFHSPRK